MVFFPSRHPQIRPAPRCRCSSAEKQVSQRQKAILGLFRTCRLNNSSLRLFVDALLEIDPVTATDREKLEATRRNNERDMTSMLDNVGNALSMITQGASLVLTPKHEAPIRHIEFVPIAADRALVVLVFADGHKAATAWWKDDEPSNIGRSTHAYLCFAPGLA